MFDQILSAWIVVLEWCVDFTIWLCGFPRDLIL